MHVVRTVCGKTLIMDFKFGEEFDDETLTGEICKTTITKESDGKLRRLSKFGGFIMEGSMEVKGDEVQMVTNIGDVKGCAVLVRAS